MEANLADDPLQLELCELTLIVRPEDKAAVARVLDGLVGGAYVSFPALGRGFDGGMQYGQIPSKPWAKWIQPKSDLGFLPKAVYWMVVEEPLAQLITQRIGAAIRLVGGPSQCAGGFAVLARIGQELPVGITPGSGCQAEDDPEAFIEDLREELVFA